MKKVIVILIIFSLIFISFFAFKKEEEKTNKNISVILETEEGNIKSDTFPSNEEYEYLSTECENTSNNVDVTFDEEEWKLDLSVEEEKVDGEFFCNIYFKKKFSYEFDFVNTDIFSNFNKTTGKGTFDTNNKGLYYSSYVNESEKWNVTSYSFDFGKDYTFDNYRITIDYQITDKVGGMAQFLIYFGNFFYQLTDAWASYEEGAGLFTAHDYSPENSKEIIRWLENSKSVATFDGKVVVTKTDDYVSLSGGYNEKQMGSFSSINFNNLIITFENVSNYELSPFYIRKIIIEEI